MKICHATPSPPPPSPTPKFPHSLSSRPTLHHHHSNVARFAPHDGSVRIRAPHEDPIPRRNPMHPTHRGHHEHRFSHQPPPQVPHMWGRAPTAGGSGANPSPTTQFSVHHRLKVPPALGGCRGASPHAHATRIGPPGEGRKSENAKTNLLSPTTNILSQSTKPPFHPFSVPSPKHEKCRLSAANLAQIGHPTPGYPTCTDGRHAGSRSAFRSTSCVSGAISPSPNRIYRARYFNGFPSVHPK